jgi:hypothetical protein
MSTVSSWNSVTSLYDNGCSINKITRFITEHFKPIQPDMISYKYLISQDILVRLKGILIDFVEKYNVCMSI